MKSPGGPTVIKRFAQKEVPQEVLEEIVMMRNDLVRLFKRYEQLAEQLVCDLESGAEIEPGLHKADFELTHKADFELTHKGCTITRKLLINFTYPLGELE